MKGDRLKDAAALIDTVFKYNLACIFAMFAGFGIDIARSPGGIISTICSGGGLYSALMFHVAVMPGAHLGMALGMALCGAWHFGRRKPRPTGMALFLLSQWGGMMIVVVGTTRIFVQSGHPSLMMLTMATLMLVLGWLSDVAGKWAASVSGHCGASRFGPQYAQPWLKIPYGPV